MLNFRDALKVVGSVVGGFKYEISSPSNLTCTDVETGQVFYMSTTLDKWVTT